MSYLKDLQEAHETLKSIAISFLLIPFWYFSIYLVNREFYINNNITILAVMSFILSLSSFFLVIFIIDNFTGTQDEDAQEGRLTSVSALSVIFLWIWKIILLFSIYSCELYFKKSLYLYFYVVIYFTPIILLLFVSIIKDIKRHNKKNKIHNK